MSKDEYIKCAKSVLNFLIESDEEVKNCNNFSTPSNIKMIDTLTTYNTNMVNFTRDINNKFMEEDLQVTYPLDFFSDHERSTRYYKKFLSILTRKDKLEKICSKLVIR